MNVTCTWYCNKTKSSIPPSLFLCFSRSSTPPSLFVCFSLCISVSFPSISSSLVGVYYCMCVCARACVCTILSMLHPLFQPSPPASNTSIQSPSPSYLVEPAHSGRNGDRRVDTLLRLRTATCTLPPSAAAAAAAAAHMLDLRKRRSASCVMRGGAERQPHDDATSGLVGVEGDDCTVG